MHRYIIAAALVAMAALASPAHSETVRARGEVPSGAAYIRTADIGVGPASEAVDLRDLSAFGTNHRSFSCAFEAEESGKNLLVTVFLTATASTSVPTSELTTPADATVGTVVRIVGAKSPRTIPGEITGWTWQGETVVADGNALCNY